MDHPNDPAPPPTDTALVERTRLGDSRAYAELWRRHAAAGRAAARSFTTTYDPDDLVSEAYARILRSIAAGGGPTTAFRAYLVRTVQNLAVSWSRQKTSESLEDADLLPAPNTDNAAALDAIDRRFAGQAFQALPEHWQRVLWYLEIEGMQPREIAPILGMSANAVSALGYRAKEGLRQAWIQAHLSDAVTDPLHRWTIERLGQFARKRLAERERAQVQAHLEECAACAKIAAEARRIESVLPWALLPLVGAVSAWMYDSSRGVTAIVAGGPGAHVGPGAHGDPGATLREQASVVPSTGSGLTRPAAALASAVAVAAGVALIVGVGSGPTSPAGMSEVPTRAGPTAVVPLPPVAAPTTSTSERRPTVPIVLLPGSPGPPDAVAVDAPLAGSPVVGPPVVWPTEPIDDIVRPPVIASVNTGDGGARGLWHPIVAGTARPGAVVTISNGPDAHVQVTAAADGSWTSGPLEGYGAGTNTVTARQTVPSGNSSIAAKAVFTLEYPPDIGVINDDVVTLFITGAHPSTVQVRTDAGGDWFEVELASTDQGGPGEYRWQGILRWDPPTGTHTISVRFGAGNRWGPTTTTVMDLGGR